jgi:hypothetical protein
MILAEAKARLYGQSETERGGSGPAAKLDPEPRTTHTPNTKGQVV